MAAPAAGALTRALHGLGKDLRFGEVLAQKAGAASGPEEAFAQLLALLQSGTPPAAVVERLGRHIAALAARALPGANDAGAPPGTGPPRVASQEALALAQRLIDLVSGLARGAPAKAGQQNRFSGQLLDADPAKELPAQQNTGPTGIASLVASLLSVAAVSPHAQPAQAAAPQPVGRVHVNAKVPLAEPPPVPAQGADLLGRILMRAAKADAQINAPAAAPSVARPPEAQAARVSPAPAQLFERLLALVAQAAPREAGGGGAKELVASAGATRSMRPPPVSHEHAFPSMLAQGTSLPADRPATFLGPVNTPAPHSTADAQSILEQVVQGIVLRNFGASSQIRIRLHPEHLGDVSLKLTVNGDRIDASIVAQNGDVRAALLANQQSLARALSDSGLSLGTFAVDVSGGNADSQRRRSGTPEDQRRALVGSFPGGDEAPVLWLDASTGPPLLAPAQQHWLFNTLA